MSEVTIRCRVDGPYVVEGNVRVTDADGNIFPLDTTKPAIALCRCGHSQKRPFCDGSHRGIEFKAAEVAPRPNV